MTPTGKKMFATMIDQRPTWIQQTSELDTMADERISSPLVISKQRGKFGNLRGTFKDDSEVMERSPTKLEMFKGFLLGKDFKSRESSD